MSPAVFEALRLQPGQDLRTALQAALGSGAAAFVVTGIGSLRPAVLRLAGAEGVLRLDEDCELLTLSGSLSPDGPHLHASVSLPDGRVLGGHVMAGSLVRTTAELLLAHLPGLQFSRAQDPTTGYAELQITKR
jgi:predicted DNA-binding protein with PD1-like motif